MHSADMGRVHQFRCKNPFMSTFATQFRCGGAELALCVRPLGSKYLIEILGGGSRVPKELQAGEELWH